VKTDALSGVSKAAKMNIDTANTTSVAAPPRAAHRIYSQKQSTAKQDFDDGAWRWQ
jgi:hypothetical protein